MIRKILILLLLVIAAIATVLAVQSREEIARYRTMRRM